MLYQIAMTPRTDAQRITLQADSEVWLRLVDDLSRHTATLTLARQVEAALDQRQGVVRLTFTVGIARDILHHAGLSS